MEGRSVPSQFADSDATEGVSQANREALLEALSAICAIL
jgi:hypothetical protein